MFTKENEFIVKNLHIKKTAGPGDFTSKLYQVFKYEIIQTLYKFFPKIGAAGTFTTSFFKANITLVTECDKDITEGQT